MKPPHQAALFYILAVFLLAVMDTAIKWLDGEYSVPQIMFYRALFAFIPIVAISVYTSRYVSRDIPRDTAGDMPDNMVGQKSLLKLKSNALWIQIVRGLFVCGALGFFTWSLEWLPLSVATSIALTGPLFMIAFGALFLKEQVSTKHLIAVILGAAGVLIIVQPENNISLFGATLTLLSAVCFGFSAILTRVLARYDSDIVTSYYTNTAIFLVAIAGLFYSGLKISDTEDTLIFVLIGVAGGLSNLFYVIALRLSAVSAIAALDYTIYLWAVIFGVTLFSEALTIGSIFGSSLIIFGGIFINFFWKAKRPQIKEIKEFKKTGQDQGPLV